MARSGHRGGPPRTPGETRSERLVALLETLQLRARRGMELGLGPTREALAALGDPQASLSCVHVAGSNGKGSTCAMVESIARRAGLRTGLYTSPHLCQFTERIRIDGEPIEGGAFERSLERVLERSGVELTFFESLTVAAFDAFRHAGIELAVIEVGLGGRLDATNVIEAPLCTAVTSISLEHCAVLGDTLDAIAREKAGIFKRGAPVVLGPLAPDADRAATEVASAAGAGALWRVGQDLSVRILSGDRTSIEGPDGRRVEAELGLRGAHQAENAAVAAGIAWRLADRWPGIGAAIEGGLAATRWPARLERIERGGATVLLDCAHNVEGAAALARALTESGVSPERTQLVFGALADKSWREMLEAVAPLAARRIYTRPQGRAAVSAEALGAVFAGEEVADPAAAVALAVGRAGAGGLVVVTGSSYLVGEVRGALLGIACDPIIAL